MGDFVGAVDHVTTSTRFIVFDHDGAGSPAPARALEPHARHAAT
jgi:glycerol kinase